jgi:hypothetical protein
MLCVHCSRRPPATPMQASCSTHVVYNSNYNSNHNMPSAASASYDSTASYDLESDSDGESDRYSMRSVSVFSTRMSSATTDTDMHSVRSTSPTRSVMSMTDSFRAAVYRHEYGRGLNNYSEVYRLPADDEELDRLGELIGDHPPGVQAPNRNIIDKQHIMFMEAMGKYVPPLPEVLADEPGQQKCCVDLGCGSGSW